MISTTQEKIGTYVARDFSHLLGLEGFSDTLLKNHFKLYQGYVTNTNEITRKLQDMSFEGKPPIEFAELSRRFGFEFSGMRLHEFYFENLIRDGKALEQNSSLAQKIDRQFGDLEGWKKEFIAIGSTRGVGWVALYYDRYNDNLFNVWIGEHHENNLPGCSPILVMDVWEHAFMTDYQLDRAAYIQAFMKNINWEIANSRFAAVAKSQP
jgi:Fe-Mn family superoxide dismutase